MEQKRIREFGMTIGRMPTGKRDKITDVPGVSVGHVTIKDADNHTGVTVILPGPGNAFAEKYTAAAYVHNGFGKSCGLVQIQELGTLETPIALTNTLNIGLVWDGLADYVIGQCREDKVQAFSINPVVGECNDCRINHIQQRAVKASHVREAIEGAGEDFPEGDVGAGAGTLCYGLKGGIGSASRIFNVDGKEYVIGVLVQSNFGATRDLVLDGRPVGEQVIRLIEKRKSESRKKAGDGEKPALSLQDQGSIMTILATDLPVSHRQLERIIRRAGVGIARTGAYTGHGSGEVMIGFTTANRIPHEKSRKLLRQTILHEDLIDQAFQAAAEATHEAILNSMVCAGKTTGIHGEIYYSLADLLPELLR